MYVNFRKCLICLKKKKTTKLETPPPHPPSNGLLLVCYTREETPTSISQNIYRKQFYMVPLIEDLHRNKRY